MTEKVNLSEARKKLPELADRASAGQETIVSRRGREMAVLIGIDEYRRLKALEEHRQQDFDLLLAPPEKGSLTEDAAQELVVQLVRQVRSTRYSKR